MRNKGDFWRFPLKQSGFPRNAETVNDKMNFFLFREDFHICNLDSVQCVKSLVARADPDTVNLT